MTDAPSSTSLDVQNQQFFDKWAQDYDQKRISGWFQHTQRLTIGQMEGLTSASKVLDVGCGTGFAVLHLGSVLTEGKACGLDISEQMIAQANAKMGDDLKDRVEFVQAGSDNIPYPDGEFDFLMCTNSFHHYPDPIKSLIEMKRVLRPGGQIVIMDNAVDLSLYTWMWDRILRVVEKGHVRYYRSPEIGEMLNKAGFEQARLPHLKNEFMKHGKLFASLMIWSGRRPASDQ